MKIEILGLVLLGFFAFHNLIRQILKYLFFFTLSSFSYFGFIGSFDFEFCSLASEV